MDRILLNRWVSRAGNAAFIISVLLFVKRQVSGWKPETLLIVVLLAAGVVLMALPYLARRKQSKGLEDKTGLPSDLADELRKGHAIRKQARFAKDRDELVVACQDFIDWGFAMNDLLREAAPELYSDVPQTAPFAFEGKGRVLEHMDARLRAHSDTVKRLQGRPPSPMGVGRAGRSRLLRELRDLIHEGEDLLATLPDPAKGDESVVFPARFTYSPQSAGVGCEGLGLGEGKLR